MAKRNESLISNQDKEWSFSFKFDVFINQNNFFEFSIVVNFGSDIIVIEWLSNLISELSVSWHGFEFKSHGGTRFEVTKFEMSSTHMSIGVEESPEFVFEFREFLLTWVTLIPFDVVIKNVNGFWFKEFA